jgi:hypothetical protein
MTDDTKSKGLLEAIFDKMLIDAMVDYNNKVKKIELWRNSVIKRNKRS